MGRWPPRERWEQGNKALPQWSESFAARQGRARRFRRRCQRGPARGPATLCRPALCRPTAWHGLFAEDFRSLRPGREKGQYLKISHKNENKGRVQSDSCFQFLKPRPGEDGPAAAAQSTGHRGTQAASAHHPRTKLQHGRRRRAPCTVDAHAGQACQVCRDRDVREALSVTCHAARRTPCGQRRARSSNRGIVGCGVADSAQSAGLTRARLRCVLFRLLWLFVIP